MKFDAFRKYESTSFHLEVRAPNVRGNVEVFLVCRTLSSNEVCGSVGAVADYFLFTMGKKSVYLLQYMYNEPMRL